ncbi:NAD(P)/FAD-dependent oxidoreductase [Muriicola sp.]|uniref:NAD(P)/FAD-dependent oxidoreductase n=1 Tax=Muriicola sp. TaxID=2020856 RepID=UPI003C770F11
MYDVIVIGGGAAGFYGAINLAESRPDLKIAILEQGKQVLGKVKVSGGGRCNVTHAQFNPKILAQHYPRGERELLGPFNTHHSEHTVQFFSKRGIELKIEDDGRMFPVTNSSQTIIDCFMEALESLKIDLIRNTVVTNILLPSGHSEKKTAYEVQTKGSSFFASRLLIATGSSPKMWNVLKQLGHRVVDPVPSLFTFNINDPRIEGIPGLSTYARVQVIARDFLGKRITVSLKSNTERADTLVSEGPLLITHWGMSGPAILKLSAWGARILHDYQYRFKIQVNWVPEYHQQGLFSYLKEVKEIEARKTVSRTFPLDIPKRLWGKLVQASGIVADQKWADISKKQLQELAKELTASEFLVEGKSTFKEEFVTAGGIDLKEVNFKTFESKLHPGIYFAGEILNIDALTGGYNFQNAWTGAYLAAQAIANS